MFLISQTFNTPDTLESIDFKVLQVSSYLLNPRWIDTTIC